MQVTSSGRGRCVAPYISSWPKTCQMLDLKTKRLLTAAASRRAACGLDIPTVERARQSAIDATSSGIWRRPEHSAMGPQSPDSNVSFLLPGFDEYLLGDQARRAAPPAEFAQRIAPGNNVVFQPSDTSRRWGTFVRCQPDQRAGATASMLAMVKSRCALRR